MGIDKSEWSKCIYCKDTIPVNLPIKKICLKCLGNGITKNKLKKTTKH